MNHKQTNGCVTLLVVLFGFALLVTYWYIFVGLAVIGGAIWYYDHQKHAQAQAAATAQAQKRQAEAQKHALAASKADQIHRFKELLDEGAITEAEFAAQKAKILDEDSFNY